MLGAMWDTKTRNAKKSDKKKSESLYEAFYFKEHFKGNWSVAYTPKNTANIKKISVILILILSRIKTWTYANVYVFQFCQWGEGVKWEEPLDENNNELFQLAILQNVRRNLFLNI